MKFTKSLLAGACAAIGVWSVCGDEAPAQPPQPPVSVVVDQATTVAESEGLPYVGIVRPIEEVALPARVSGWLEKINFTEGGMVEKGDLLFEIEDTSYQAEVAAAKASLAQAVAENDYAKKEYDRKYSLHQRNAVALTELQNAERAVASTAAQIAAAEAVLMRAENELSYTKIYAPISGKIGKATYTVGNYVTPSNAPHLADIVQIDPIHVQFALSDRDFLNRFSADGKSTEAVLTIVPANREKYAGEISVDFVDNRVYESTGTVTMWLRCENADGRLIPDGFVTVRLADRFEKPLAAVSVTAILTDSKGSFVYVLEEDNIPVRRDIILGPVVGNMQTVAAGLEEGETVIVDGTHKVIPGTKVNPVPRSGLNYGAPDGGGDSVEIPMAAAAQ